MLIFCVPPKPPRVLNYLDRSLAACLQPSTSVSKDAAQALIGYLSGRGIHFGN
jgi:hypothetical protein